LADPPILQGRKIDGPLSEEGTRQASQAAACLATQKLAGVYSSPLRRAQETAQHIARPHGLTVQTLDAIVEAELGAWEGRSWAEIRATEPDPYHLFQDDPAHHGYRQGENLTQVAQRAVPAVEAILQTHLGAAIAIVGHNVVNRVVLAHALGMPLARARGIIQHNGGINLLRWHGGRLEAVTVNSVFHLMS
jgi:broad specificity phosphatase PhoE